MQLVERSALVVYTAAQMFALVNEVERYPEFLPWCAAAQVKDVSATERTATVRVARGVLQTEFTTLNRNAPSSKPCRCRGAQAWPTHCCWRHRSRTSTPSILPTPRSASMGSRHGATNC